MAHLGVRIMSAGQSSGTGAMTELEDEKVRKEGILSNRDKAQRLPDQSLDGKGVQIDEYNDNPANQRPTKNDYQELDTKATAEEPVEDSTRIEKPKITAANGQIDRPGIDLGGSTGETHAGKGLGLGTDASEGRRNWDLPR